MHSHYFNTLTDTLFLLCSCTTLIKIVFVELSITKFIVHHYKVARIYRTNYFQLRLLWIYDVPNGVFQKMKFYNQKRHEYKILLHEEFIDPNVKHLIPFEWRKCKFPEETDGMWSFNFYSETACRAQCFAGIKMEICNCTDTVIGFSSSKY